MRTSGNIQVVSYISTPVRALKIYPELPRCVNSGMDFVEA
jgi:hypothetical protein